jgi:putative membrane protein insertion efficiency factor
MKKVLIHIINFYQTYLSPDHSAWGKKKHPHGYCPFHPSCSEYTKLVIEKYGWMTGVFLGIGRIIRCHPWSKGGIDLP